MTLVSAGPVTVRTSEGARMILTVLIAVLLLVLAGYACVFWAARGGPRWTHAVAKATVAAGRAASVLLRPGRSGTRSGSDSDDGGSD